MVENALDRMALENRCCDTANSVRNYKAHHRINGPPEAFLWENAEIEQQDGYLRQGDGALVEDLEKPKHLRIRISSEALGQMELGILAATNLQSHFEVVRRKCCRHLAITMVNSYTSYQQRVQYQGRRYSWKDPRAPTDTVGNTHSDREALIKARLVNIMSISKFRASKDGRAARPHRYNHGETYHRDDDGIIILAQTPTDHQSRRRAGNDEAKADNIERNRDDD